MTVLKAVEQRRSIKNFDPTHVMPQADIKTLLGAAMLSPTSFNIQNWRFVVVTDIEQKKKLRAAAWDQAQLEQASIVIVLCADLMAWEKNPRRYWHLAPQGVQDYLLPMITTFYQGQQQLQRDEAMRSVGMAAQTLMLAAVEMGYDSCPMIGFNPQQVAQIINLPQDHVIGMVLTIGKKTADARPRSGPLAMEEVVFDNSFQAE